jgi:hypothetical protein
MRSIILFLVGVLLFPFIFAVILIMSPFLIIHEITKLYRSIYDEVK